jgi:hypothetical protein
VRRTFAVLLAVASMLGCARKPAVTIEQVQETEGSASKSQRVFPPRCEEIPVPGYPEVAMDRRPDKVSVRVDFVIDRDGVPQHVRATPVVSSPGQEPYVQASIEAADRIRCKPAWSPPRPGSGDHGPRLRDYRSSLIFHFLKDEREANVSF